MSHPHPELGAPPKLPKGGLRVTPLGGLGEIGRNMTVFEYGGRLLIVDCGVLFPEEEQPGIDLILPDFTSIRDRLDDIEGIVLTHGHEDHIGGVPYLLGLKPDIPLIGSKLTLALIEAKLQEHRIRPYTLEVTEGHRERIGPFDCEFVAVNHSIPDALAVAIRTPAGMVGAHRRLQDGPATAGRPPHRPARLRQARRGGHRPSAGRLDQRRGPRLRPARARHLQRAAHRSSRTPAKRIIVASFASHVHRIQQILDAAHEYGRRVAFVGRSMVRNMGIARDLGYLKVPPGLVVDVKTLDDLPDDEVVLVCTGSQGEPMAALSRMANRDHQIRIVQGDTVILASSLIPGNENAVYRVINGLTRWGANVVHKGNAKVHVSGHASAGELLYFYNICKPQNLMPVHGEWRHLRANAELGALTGCPEGPHRHRRGRRGRRPGRRQGEDHRQGPGRLCVRRRPLGRRRHASPRSRTAASSATRASSRSSWWSTVPRGKIVGGPYIQARGSGIEDAAFSRRRARRSRKRWTSRPRTASWSRTSCSS